MALVDVFIPRADAAAAGPSDDAAAGDARGLRLAQRRGPMRPSALAPVRERLDAPALRALFRGVDTAAAACAALAATVAAGPLWLQPLGAVAPVAGQAAAALGMLALADAYRFGRAEPRWLQPLRVVVAAAAALATAAALSAVLPGSDRREALAAAAATSAALALSQAWAALRVRRWRRAGRLTPNIVVVGATADAGRLIARALGTRDVNVLGVFDDRADRAPPNLAGVPVLGDTAALLEHRLLPYIDRVVIAVSAASQARTRTLTERLRVLPNLVTVFADLSREQGRADALARLADSPLVAAGPQADARRAALKRAQDLAISGLALAALSPVMLLTALAVKLDSPGPVLFRQTRHGFSNEPITVLKFRSMHADRADPAGVRQVTADDARVTRVGRVIRRASLDELPQLWNVLTGQMSLVGPRPHAIGMKTAGVETKSFVAEYAWRCRMKPGLTGWAQVNGSRGPVHTAAEVRRRVQLDLAYIERQSFWFDLYIMALTLPRLFGDGAAVR